MIFKFYDKNVLVGTPVISGIQSTSWKRDAKAILAKDAIKGNGYGVVIAAKEGETSVIVYTEDTPAKPGTYSLSAVLSKLCQLQGISAAMFVEDNYVICIERGVPIYEFTANDRALISTRAEYTYAQSFSAGCSVFGNKEVFNGATDFDVQFRDFINTNKGNLFCKETSLQRYEVSPVLYITVGVLVVTLAAGGYFYYLQAEKKKAAIAAEKARLAAEATSPKALYEAFETEWIAGKRDGCAPLVIKNSLSKFTNNTPFETEGWILKKISVSCRENFAVSGESKMIISASYSNTGTGTNQAFLNRMKAISKGSTFDFKLSLNEALINVSSDVDAPQLDKSKVPSFDAFIINSGSQMQKLNQVPILFSLSDAVFINGVTEKTIEGVQLPLKAGKVLIGGQGVHLNSVFNRFSDFTIKKLDLAFDNAATKNVTFNMDGYYVTH